MREYKNVTDGKPTPPPNAPADLTPDEVFVQDNQYANVYWQWDYPNARWLQLTCPAGTVYDANASSPGTCDFPMVANNGAPFVLNDPTIGS